MKDLTAFITKDLKSLKVEFKKRPLFLLALTVVFVSFIYANFFHKSRSLPYKEKENVTLSDNTGYENTVIWVFIDYVDGKQVVTEFNGLYALPKGFGINCCSPDYVLDCFDSLQSKYIFTYDGALVSEKCEEADYRMIGRYGKSVMYERY